MFYLKFLSCDIQGFHSGAAEDSVFPGRYAVGKY